MVTTMAGNKVWCSRPTGRRSNDTSRFGKPEGIKHIPSWSVGAEEVCGNLERDVSSNFVLLWGQTPENHMPHTNARGVISRSCIFARGSPPTPLVTHIRASASAAGRRYCQFDASPCVSVSYMSLRSSASPPSWSCPRSHFGLALKLNSKHLTRVT